MTMASTEQQSILVLGGTGKTGRRVVERLTARGLPVRVGLAGWQPTVRLGRPIDLGTRPGGRAVDRLTYYPDSPSPATEADALAAELAVRSGVSRRLSVRPRRARGGARRAGRTPAPS